MKRYTQAFAVAALAALSQWAFTQPVTAQPNPHLYRVFIQANGVTTNDSGQVAGIFASNFEIIRKCASDNGISDPRMLTLVYDRDADALEVVNRTNGAVVCTPFSFSGGTGVTNRSGAFRERLAFVFLEDSEDAAGSLRGSERYIYDMNGAVTRFNLTGRIQFAVTGTGKRNRIYSAFFSTGPRFVPGPVWGY